MLTKITLKLLFILMITTMQTKSMLVRIKIDSKGILTAKIAGMNSILTMQKNGTWHLSEMEFASVMLPKIIMGAKKQISIQSNIETYWLCNDKNELEASSKAAYTAEEMLSDNDASKVQEENNVTSLPKKDASQTAKTQSDGKIK